MVIKAEGRRLAEFTKAALKVLIQEGIENRIQAAVDVSQGDEEVHRDQRVKTAQVETQKLSQDHDLDGGPTHNEHSHNNQYHPGDAAQVAILFLGARQDANVSQAFDHQTVADADNGHRDQEREEEDTGAKNRIPICLWLVCDQNALNTWMHKERVRNRR